MRVKLDFILLIAVGLLLAGSLPWYPYSRRWGYASSAFLALAFAVILVAVVL